MNETAPRAREGAPGWARAAKRMGGGRRTPTPRPDIQARFLAVVARAIARADAEYAAHLAALRPRRLDPAAARAAARARFNGRRPSARRPA